MGGCPLPPARDRWGLSFRPREDGADRVFLPSALESILGFGKAGGRRNNLFAPVCPKRTVAIVDVTKPVRGFPRRLCESGDRLDLVGFVSLSGERIGTRDDHRSALSPQPATHTWRHDRRTRSCTDHLPRIAARPQEVYPPRGEQRGQQESPAKMGSSGSNRGTTEA